VREYLRQATENIGGTYVVRLFAAFEAALRSFDRTKHNDQTRDTKAAVMIDEIGGKRGRGIAPGIRQRALRLARTKRLCRWPGMCRRGRLPIRSSTTHCPMSTQTNKSELKLRHAQAVRAE
jgi:hypothetical protein